MERSSIFLPAQIMLRRRKVERDWDNEDTKKICSANGVDPNSEEWSFIWNEPFGYEFNEYEAKKRVNQINNERAENGTLKTHGRVKYMKRVVQFGDWADV